MLACFVCIFPHFEPASQKGYFTSTLESGRKDVECTFGILKKRVVCKEVFATHTFEGITGNIKGILGIPPDCQTGSNCKQIK